MLDNRTSAETRAAHYLFAHTALRQICATDPKYFFKAFASEAQQTYLQLILDQVNEHCQDEPADFSAADIKITMTRNGAYPMLVFSMPQPKVFGECLHVALILLIDLNRETKDEPVEFKFYTQELGKTENQQSIFLFCEWHNDEHVNIGAMNDDSNLEDFALAIKQHLGQPEL
jgi:hypothetical protein